MPIVTTPNDDSPLNQGDILKGIRLYSTADNWDDGQELGGSAQLEAKFELCLVLSRPCVLEHKTDFIVAAVHGIKEAPPPEVVQGKKRGSAEKGDLSPDEKVEAYRRVRAFLESLRDGVGRTDRFYLGRFQIFRLLVTTRTSTHSTRLADPHQKSSAISCAPTVLEDLQTNLCGTWRRAEKGRRFRAGGRPHSRLVNGDGKGLTRSARRRPRSPRVCQGWLPHVGRVGGVGHHDVGRRECRGRGPPPACRRGLRSCHDSMKVGRGSDAALPSGAFRRMPVQSEGQE